MMQTRSRSSLTKEEYADKLSKKRSASFKRDCQKIGKRITPISKEAPELKIPQHLYVYVYLALGAEQKLETHTSDKGLEQELSYYKERIGILAKRYKATGHLPADWEYHPDTASSCVSSNVCLLPAKKEPKKNIPRNPHIDSVPLGAGAKAAWRSFKKLDKSTDNTTLIGLPFSAEELKTPLDTNNEFVTYIRDFAVEVFNDSCQMYRNKKKKNKNISDAKVVECKYLKVRPNYIFYMRIEALEQDTIEVYKVNLRCDLVNGAIVVDKFCLTPEPSGTKEGDFTSLEFIHATVKDDSTNDPELCYHISGLVRRAKGGYDFYNPCGWNRLWEWAD